MIATHALARGRRARLPAAGLLLLATGLPATATVLATCEAKVDPKVSGCFLNLRIWDIPWFTGGVPPQPVTNSSLAKPMPREWDDSIVNSNRGSLALGSGNTAAGSLQAGPLAEGSLKIGNVKAGTGIPFQPAMKTSLPATFRDPNAACHPTGLNAKDVCFAVNDGTHGDHSTTCTHAASAGGCEIPARTNINNVDEADYTALPEPAVGLLIGAGLVSLAIVKAWFHRRMLTPPVPRPR
jgi:hypothetical protein